MKFFSMLCISALAYASFSYARPAAQSQEDAERYIVESEQGWAESVASGDTKLVERIIADDFVGVDTDGSLYDKKQMIKDAPDGPKHYESNHVNSVKVRFYGDAAVAQGSESWVKRTGEHRYGKFVWTDTWIRRNGQWQIVAAEDLIVLEPAHKQ